MNTEKMYISPNMANKIKERAKLINVSLKAMLEDLQLGSNTFSHMKHGRMIAADSLARIADYLDCSVDYLLGRSDNPDSHKNSMREKNQPVLVYRAARSDDHDGAEMAPPSREHLETIVQAPEDDVKSAEQKPQE